jgi:hypothetical protein
MRAWLMELEEQHKPLPEFIPVISTVFFYKTVLRG